MIEKFTERSSSSSFDTETLIKAIDSLIELMPADTVDLSTIKAAKLTKLRVQIQTAIEKLQKLYEEIGPAKQPPFMLDPSDPAVVGKLVATTLLVQSRIPLNPITKFYGSGVYAIYYKGPFDAYTSMSGTETPIYIGKADPALPQAKTATEQGIRLWNRLKDHRKSIAAAANLELNDFDCRFLVVTSGWQGAAEIHLINHFLPIWNNETGICYGFGKHGDDPKTRTNTRSPWDTLHPGRSWATKEGNVPYSLSPEEIKAQISQHFIERPPVLAVDKLI